MNIYKDALHKLIKHIDFPKSSQRAFDPKKDEPRKYYIALQELVDKATPLTVNYISFGDADGYPVYDTIQCPNCTEIFDIEEVDIKQYKYCPYCGQHWDNIKLDYMEED